LTAWPISSTSASPLDTPNDSRIPAVRRKAAAATIHSAAPTSAPGRQSRQQCLTFGL
jgi:hypothetical protein